MKFQIYFERRQWADATDIYIVLKDHNGKRKILKPTYIEFVPIKEDGNIDPSFTVKGSDEREFFPALVDAMAKCGYRYESSDAGELKATKIHLEDMRKIVFEGCAK